MCLLYGLDSACFEVTVPASVLSLTVSPEFVATLEPGEHVAHGRLLALA